MIKDFVAHLLTSHSSALEELAKAEADFKAAKNLRDRAGQDRAQATINAQRRILTSRLPSAAFHYADATHAADAEGLRSEWEKQVLATPAGPQITLQDTWQLADLANLFENPRIVVTDLPPLSFCLSFHFTLAKPYISHDEDAFYIIDNPVRKDKVLRLPFIAPSTYKGSLRSAARYVIGNPPEPETAPDDPIIERLFGTDKRRNTKDLHQGRLWFFPTFFHQVGLEVINPHGRDTRAGTVPIPLEVAKGGGEFHLLYFPFDLPANAFQQVAEDIEAVAKAVQAMFLAYGLAAKKTSGFGVAQNQVKQFSWQVHHWRPKALPSAGQELLQIQEPALDLNSLPDLARDRLANVLREEGVK